MWWLATKAGLDLVQGLHQAESIRSSAEITKQVAEMNAQFAELDSYQAEQDGLTKAARYQTSIDKLAAEQTAALAGSNIDIGFGTAGELTKQTKLTGELNTLDIINQAHAKALGLKQEARNQRLGAFLSYNESMLRAKSTEGAAILKAGTTALSGYARSASTSPESPSSPSPSVYNPVKRTSGDW